jgi:hypothetical protein
VLLKISYFWREVMGLAPSFFFLSSRLM